MTVSRARSRQVRRGALALALGLAVGACGGGEPAESGGQRLSGSIRIDGSSTVAPLSEAAAERFMEEHNHVRITVGTSGTGGGFEKFCNGETDVSDASRPIKQSEKDACAAKGIRYEQLTVANDGLAVVVNPQNTWVTCLTVDQLKKVWAPRSTVSNWRDVDPSFPDERIALFGAGTDSGTFDYFTEAVNGKEGASRTDYTASEDDNVTVSGVAGTKGAIGYLGLSYVEENQGRVKAVAVDGGAGCVAPSAQTVQNSSYKPLGRPLFIYPKADALQRPEVREFVRSYIENAEEIAADARFVPMTEAQKQESLGSIQTLLTS
ncbi:MAG TPA: PstS family phosphate ABC transporter substrate-binding protein [Acidimicrobiales bacterium]|nr:PstS family phosphate ABC transporter substrate-binding protein [Acidimicrobiales bacterium]